MNTESFNAEPCPFCQLGQPLQQDSIEGGYLKLALNEDLLIIRFRPDDATDQTTVTFEVNFCQVCGRQIYDAPVTGPMQFETLYWTDPAGSQIKLCQDGDEFVLIGTPLDGDAHEIQRYPNLAVMLDLTDYMALENQWTPTILPEEP